MLDLIKDKLRYTFLFDIINNRRQRIAYTKWIKNGKPFPAPLLAKRKTIIEYAKINSINTFVETGTFLGATVYALRKKFNKIYSIELNRNLYNKTKNKFLRYNNIEILQGNSAEVLKNLIKIIKEPTIFFLDAHYCSENTSGKNEPIPIFEELDIILKNKNNHIILIDDAYCFEGKNKFISKDYYPTIQELREFVLKKNLKASFKVKNDIIHILL